MSTTIFTADDGVHGRELWRTDGTASGTVLVTDLKAGSGDGFPTNGAYQFTSAGPNVFFVYDDGTHGSELWATDGSANGTRLVRDINPGSASCAITGSYAIGDRLYFTANDGTHGQELWTSDGTPEGTHLVADLSPGAASSNLGNFASYQGRLSFTAGTSLYLTDGSEAGTQLAASLAPAGTTNLTAALAGTLGTRLVFSTEDAQAQYTSGTSQGLTLVLSDGTAAGTMSFSVAAPRPEGGNVQANGRALALDEKLYFEASDYYFAYDAATKTSTYHQLTELWTTDGTAAGTRSLADLGTASGASPLVAVGGSVLFVATTMSAANVNTQTLMAADGLGAHLISDNGGAGFSQISQLVTLGGTAYFIAYDGRTNSSGLWASTGLGGSTTKIYDFGSSAISSETLVVHGSELRFRAPDDGVHGSELWASDGTAAGTRLVSDVNPTVGEANASAQSYDVSNVLYRGNGQIVFQGYDQAHGDELWVTDGTPAGTHRATDLAPGVNGSVVRSIGTYPTVTGVNGKIVFTATDGRHGAGYDLWVADDASLANARLLADLPDTLVEGRAKPLGTIGNQAFYGLQASPRHPSLYVTDGTDSGTYLVRDFAASNNAGIAYGTSFGNTLAFVVGNNQLYVSDGTADGTILLRQGSLGYAIVGIYNDRLIFEGLDSGQSAGQLFATDGTVAGTQPIRNYDFGSTFAKASGGLLGITSGTGGNVLNVTDGTAAGTHRLLDTSRGYLGFESSLPSDGQGNVYFKYINADGSASLWVTDGTTAGTHQFGNAVLPASATKLSYDNGRFVFFASDAEHGLEPWITDGTAAGTHMIADVNPGSGSATSTTTGYFQTTNGLAYFLATDGVHAYQLWRTDGTAAGTLRLTDTPVNLDSAPADLTLLIPTGEAAIAAPKVMLTHDTGLSAQDTVTNDAALTITPAVSGGRLSYVVDGVAASSYDPASLGQGGHTVTVTQTDDAGQTSAPGTITFTLDTVAPVNAIDTPSSYPARAGTPTPIQGHTDAGEAGDRVEIVEGGNVLGGATVDGSGTWSVPVMLAEGPHHLTAALTDPAGNVGSATIDLTAGPGDPTAPDTQPPSLAVTGVRGPGNHETGHVLGGTIDAADAGAIITIRDGSTVLGTTQADSSGAFSFGFSDSKDGPAHSDSFTASATDAAGNTGTSDAFVFSFDYTQNQTQFGTLTHDPMSHVGQVYALYEGLLDRAPDQGGAQGWVDALDHGASLAQVTQGFLNSTEERSHITVSGNSNAAYVEQLYETVLHRQGDTTGAQGWVNFLNQGGSRVDVADAFVFSTEHENQLSGAYQAGVYLADPGDAAVARLYYGVLDRAPDAGGLQGWEGAVHSGASLSSIAQGFLTSPEYAQLHPSAQTDKQFVDGLYQDALGRAAEPSGEQGWLNALASGTSRADVAVGIAESAEAQQHLSGHIEQGWHLA